MERYILFFIYLATAVQLIDRAIYLVGRFLKKRWFYSDDVILRALTSLEMVGLVVIETNILLKILFTILTIVTVFIAVMGSKGFARQLMAKAIAFNKQVEELTGQHTGHISARQEEALKKLDDMEHAKELENRPGRSWFTLGSICFVLALAFYATARVEDHYPIPLSDIQAAILFFVFLFSGIYFTSLYRSRSAAKSE